MQHTLQEHITRLENLLQTLGWQVMNKNLSRQERNKIEAEIRAAHLAISHYKTALEIERALTFADEISTPAASGE